MKKQAVTTSSPSTKKKKSELPEWMSLKSGAMRHSDGDWFASMYGDGWYFYTRKQDVHLGPFKSFEEGVIEWRKKK